jgi:hypothetical protein
MTAHCLIFLQEIPHSAQRKSVPCDFSARYTYQYYKESGGRMSHFAAHLSTMARIFDTMFGTNVAFAF